MNNLKVMQRCPPTFTTVLAVFSPLRKHCSTVQYNRSVDSERWTSIIY